MSDSRAWNQLLCRKNPSPLCIVVIRGEVIHSDCEPPPTPIWREGEIPCRDKTDESVEEDWPAYSDVWMFTHTHTHTHTPKNSNNRRERESRMQGRWGGESQLCLRTVRQQYPGQEHTRSFTHTHMKTHAHTCHSLIIIQVVN